MSAVFSACIIEHMLNAGIARRYDIEMIEATEEEVLRLPPKALALLDSLILQPGVEVWAVERETGPHWRIGIRHPVPCVTTVSAPAAESGRPGRARSTR